MKQKSLSVLRIAAISDGVFAIAMTLLVLDVKVPELAGNVSNRALAGALLEEAPSIFSWLISFAILCRLWITQHALLDVGEHRSRAFAGVNFVFLGAISFIPFPTALVSEHPKAVLSVVVFSACYAIAGLALGVMWYLVKASPDWASEYTAEEDHVAKRMIVSIPVLAVGASLLALVKPELGIAVWVLLPFLGITVRWRETMRG